MAVSYIPPTDAGLDDWATNFATLISADPSLYGLDSVAAAAIQSARDAYHDAYLLGGTDGTRHPVNPSTYTPVTVAAKDAAKLAGKSVWRIYAAQIRINPGVTNDDKIALRLNLPNSSGTPIPAPVSWPLLTVVSSGPLTTVLRYKDSVIGVGKAKAAGAIQMNLFWGFGTAPIVDPTLLTLAGAFTKSPLQFSIDPANAGKIMTLGGQWVTRRGLVGPFGPLITTTVVGS